MLHQFTFRNFKSFQEEATLDLTASAIKDLPTDVVVDVLHEPVLKLAALYGANASGKSNVLKAFQTMTYVVLASFSDEDALRKVKPFWFEDSATPTDFSVLFSTATNIYQYGFSCVHGTITAEYLYQRDKQRVGEQYLEIFDRTVTGITGQITAQAEVQTLEKLIEPGTLLLSALARLNLPVIKEVMAWFRSVQVLDYGDPRGEVNKNQRLQTRHPQNPLINLLTDETEKARFEAFIRAIDVGIAGLGVVSDDYNLASDTEPHQRVVAFHRHPRTGKLMQTPIAAESSGTRKMLMLYVDLKQALEQGNTILIDELDAKLHPLHSDYVP